ncbi:erythrocyte binding antigen-175 [Plasmodium reichenowi]|uniref:Erythrocyte binding antigen-175 n=1 Tax=Plasmodium reichenowi TaxID=5854 RepID=A0A2P9DSB5_PLARE|nr:erythrocyte binding antigen-175 [Plasmodium reichenowi]
MKCNISIYFFSSFFVLYFAKARNEYDIKENEKFLEVYKEKFNELDKKKYGNVQKTDKKIFSFIENKLDILNNSKSNKRWKSYGTPDNIDKNMSLINKYNNKETFNNNYQSFLSTSSLIKQNRYVPINAVRVSRILSFLDSKINNGRNTSSNDGDLRNCREKRKGNEWDCKKKNGTSNYVCIPDRRIQLCIVNLSIIKTYTKETMKDHFIEASRRESQLLLKKNDNNYNSKFCNDLKNSFLDYGHLAMGNDMDFGGYSTKAENKIQEVFKGVHGKISEHEIKNFRKKWWNEFREKLWEAMISEHKNNLSDCKNIPEEELQINQWIKEWHGEFLSERNNRLKLPKSKCKNNTLYEACAKECIDPCMKYRDWIIKSKFEWHTLSKEYERKNVSNKDAEKYLIKFSKNNDAKVSLLLDNCDAEYSKYCDCKHTTTLVKSVLNGKDNTSKGERETIDLDDFSKFGCDKNSVDTNRKEWECKKPYILSTKDVCVPPRRQELCLGNIDRIYDKNLLMIKEHILAIAIYESRILKRKYKNKDDNEVCNVINKSFADIRDIIKGSDYWNDLSNRKLVGKINTNSKYVHKNKENDKLFRDEWWNVIKKDVWNVMSWVFKDKTVCKEDDIENIPQFFRWFSEWGDDYCQDKLKMIDTLKVACEEKGYDDITCKNKCSSYKDWISKQKYLYDKQVTIYKEYQRNNNRIYPIVKTMEPKVYLKEYSKKCSNINFEDEFNEEVHSDYKNKCMISTKVRDVPIPAEKNVTEALETVVPKENTEIERKNESDTEEQKNQEIPNNDLKDSQQRVGENGTKVSSQEDLRGSRNEEGVTQEFGLNDEIPKGEEQISGKSGVIQNRSESETGISTTEESRHEEGHNEQTLSTSVDQSELSDTLQLHEDTKENDKLPLESSAITSPTESGSSDTEETPSISEGPKRNEQKERDDDSSSKISVSPEISRTETHDKDTSNLLRLKEDVDISMPKAVIGKDPNGHINNTAEGDHISGVNSSPLSDGVRPDKKELEDQNGYESEETVGDYKSKSPSENIRNDSDSESVAISESSSSNTGLSIDDDGNDGTFVRTQDTENTEDVIRKENTEDVIKEENTDKDEDEKGADEEIHSTSESLSSPEANMLTDNEEGNSLNHEEVKEHTSNPDNVQQSGENVNMNVENQLKDTLENTSSSLGEGKAHEELSEPNLSSGQDMSNTPGPLDNTSEETTERISNNEYKVNEREDERTLTKEYEDIVLKSHMNRESDDDELDGKNSDVPTVNDESEDVEEKMKRNDTSEISEDSSQRIENNQQENDMKTVGDLGTIHVQNEINDSVTGENKEQTIHGDEGVRLSHKDIHKINLEDKNSNILHLKDMRNEENERKQLANQNINISQQRDLQEHGFHTMNNLHGDGVSEGSQINHGNPVKRQDRGKPSGNVLNMGSNNNNFNNIPSRYNLYDKKLNLDLYVNRNDSTTKELIKKLAEINKCENEISAKYCSDMIDKEIPLKTCTKEKTINLCCAVADYCLSYFTYDSKEYSNCTKREFEDPSYTCFRKKGFSSMPYYAGAGVLFIILVIVGASQAKDQSSDEVLNENNENNFTFEVTDNLDKLSNMFNQQVQETNIKDFSEYNEDINAC